MPNIKTVEQRWQEYADLVLPKLCSDVQRTETRRAFFAGFYSCLVFSRDEIGAPDFPEDAGVLALQLMHDECEAFYRDVAARRK